MCTKFRGSFSNDSGAGGRFPVNAFAENGVIVLRKVGNDFHICAVKLPKRLKLSVLWRIPRIATDRPLGFKMVSLLDLDLAPPGAIRDLDLASKVPAHTSCDWLKRGQGPLGHFHNCQAVGCRGLASRAIKRSL